MSKDLFGNDVSDLEKYRVTNGKTPKANPMIAVYGSKAGYRCKQCVHLLGREFAKTYWKCELRKITHSPATDHRKNWPACGKFEEDKNL